MKNQLTLQRYQVKSQIRRIPGNELEPHLQSIATSYFRIPDSELSKWMFEFDGHTLTKHPVKL